MTQSPAQPAGVLPDAAHNSKAFKKALMDQLRARGGTQAVDTKEFFQSMLRDTLEAFLEVEMEEHLGYARHDPEGRGSGNSRNGATGKTVRDFGEVEIERRRDRNGSFEPKIVAERQTSVVNFTEAEGPIKPSLRRLSIYVLRITHPAQLKFHAKPGLRIIERSSGAASRVGVHDAAGASANDNTDSQVAIHAGLSPQLTGDADAVRKARQSLRIHSL